MIIPKILELRSPDTPLPLIFDSPHSGTVYPDDFDYSCDFHLLQKAEDKHVDDLFATAPDYGACFLKALFPRTYIDVNRAPCDIDPDLYDGDWPYDDVPVNPTNRSDAGIGLIRRLIKQNVPVQNHKLKPKEIKSRIETYYHPYHDTLQKIIEGAHQKFGQVWHINCHSMPSAGKRLGVNNRSNPFSAPDFVLGDRNGTSCDPDFTHSLRDFLKNKGYKVAINDPYKGVELVRRYANPASGRHSIQIEICKSLYMNEETFEKNKNFKALKANMDDLIVFCADYAQSNLIPLAAD
jgi:N-formylglutamate amidohydrolase